MAEVIVRVMHVWKGSAECKENGNCRVDTDPVRERVGQGTLLLGSRREGWVEINQRKCGMGSGMFQDL